MDGLTEEQRLFAEMGEGFVNALVTATRMYPDNAGDTWHRLCDLGIPSVLVPQGSGGYGGGAVESFLVGWIQGNGLPDTLLLPTAISAASLVAASPPGELGDQLLAALCDGTASLAYAHHEQVVDPSPAQSWLEARLSPANGQYRLVGEKVCVLGGGHASAYLVSARLDDGIAIVHVPTDAAGVTVVPQQLVDGRSAARIRFAEVAIAPEDILANGSSAAGVTQKADRLTTIALIGEGLGALEKALKLASEHISTREQFGGPLSRFQVLRHRIADVFMIVREIEALGLRAARAIDLGAGDADSLLRSAKIHLGMSGVKAAEQCVQLHGAMGITEEVDVGRCLKRVVTIDCLFGNARQHLELASDALQAEFQAA